MPAASEILPIKVQSSAVHSVRVALYMRVSTEEQSTEGFSPDFQLAQLQEYVHQNASKGWVTCPGWHFFDIGSGARMEGRQQLENLRKLVRKNEVDLVLVWRIDRMARNLADLIFLFEEMSKHGVGFASMKENLDFTGPIGKLIFQIFGSLAEFERENIRMRTEEGRKASARAGNYTGGTIPYGYRGVPNPDKRGKRLEVVEEEARIIRQIFSWFVHDNRNFEWISRELNRLGIAKATSNNRSRGTQWYPDSLKHMLEREEYRGYIVTNRYKKVSSKPRRFVKLPEEEWITISVPSIIDDITFLQSQQRLRDVCRTTPRGGGKKQYLLRGKLVDLETGKGFIGYLSAKQTKNYRRKQFSKDGKHVKSLSIAAGPIEKFVWEYIEKAIDNPDEFLRLHQEQMEDHSSTEKLKAQLHVCQEALSKANHRLQRVQKDYFDGNITHEQREEYAAVFTQERDTAYAEKKDLETTLLRIGNYDAACKHLQDFSERMKYRIKKVKYPEKRMLVEMLVERVEIYWQEPHRMARAYFRFNPSAISMTPSGCEPNISLQKPKTTNSYLQSHVGGASDGIRTHDPLDHNQML